jgi:hypothetical protein
MGEVSSGICGWSVMGLRFGGLQSARRRSVGGRVLFERVQLPPNFNPRPTEK